MVPRDGVAHEHQPEPNIYYRLYIDAYSMVLLLVYFHLFLMKIVHNSTTYKINRYIIR